MALGIFTHPIGAFAQLDPDDPWPKYGGNEGNTCYTTIRGPHAPELRWYAPIAPSSPAVYHHSGVAIARIDDVDYAIVGTPAAVAVTGGTASVVSIYAIDDPGHSPSTPATAVQTIELDDAELIRSTPLVLPNRWIVVQTTQRLIAYDISGLPSSAPAFKWQSVELESNGASPAYGHVTRFEETGTERVFAQGVIDDEIVVISIDPTVTSMSDRSFEWVQALRPYYTNWPVTNCPALGTLDDDDPLYDEDGVRLLYCATAGDPVASTDDHVFALFADGGTHGTASRIAWSYRMDDAHGNVTSGAFGSPGVHGSLSQTPDRVVVTSDDGGIYGFLNRSDLSGSSLRRWLKDGLDSFSRTAVLTHDSDVLCSDEGTVLYHDRDDDTSLSEGGDVAIHKGNSVRGTPAGDAHRVYISTPGPSGSFADGQRLLAYCYSAGTPGTPSLSWRYLPPSTIRFDFLSSIAVSTSGVLLAVNDGYLVAVGPVRGDFNGDGCRNNFDIDPFALALHEDPAEWETEYGAPFGLNVLGIGDCNGDGYFNNFDIDCFADLVVYDPYCAEDFIGPCGGEGDFGGEGRSAEEQWEYFWNRIAELYAAFNM
ncbi:MAG: hypothetical protein AB7Q17_17330 [Phycisphaerae bacterium]